MGATGDDSPTAYSQERCGSFIVPSSEELYKNAPKKEQLSNTFESPVKIEAHTNMPSSTNTFNLKKNAIDYKVCIEAKKTMKKRIYNIVVYRADDPRDKNYITISPEVDMLQKELLEYLKTNL